MIEFVRAMLDAGLSPPDLIEPGRLYRFPGEGKTPINRAGWCRLFDGGVGGVFGDWSTGLSETWQPENNTSTQNAEFKKRVIEARRKANAERKRLQASASEQAEKIWNRSKPAKPDHTYLTNKKIMPYGIRQSVGALLVPVRNVDGDLLSLQFISRTGDKRFLRHGQIVAGYFAIGDPSSVICICEGFATGASIRDATGYAVAVAFNAGNLETVAKALAKKFSDKKIIICGDNDANGTGQRKAEQAAKAIECGFVIPPIVGDFNDLASSHGIDAVKNRINEVKNRVDDTNIINLAGLTPLEYEKRRKAEAKKLGVRASVLDQVVQNVRDKSDMEEPDGELENGIKPWPRKVSGAELIESIRSAFNKYCVLPEHGDVALTLWALSTYVYDAFRVFPKLCLSSPEKRCGKTTTLEILGSVCHRALMASNVSPAVIFRAVDLWRPSLLIDEGDTFIGDSEELRGIINSGHTRATAFVLRVEGDSSARRPVKFSTWAPMAIAMIKSPPDTIRDRAVMLNLRRKLRTDVVSPMPVDIFRDHEPIRQRCARWAQDSIGLLRTINPTLPDVGNDRALDNWRPLVAVAELIGGGWPDIARRAMEAFEAGGDGDNADVGTLLLQDVKTAFEEASTDRLFSAELVDSLVAMEDRPWPEWRHGKPLSKLTLSKLLEPYKIASRQIRKKYDTKKGYLLDDFQDAFKRYIPSDPPKNCETTKHPSNDGASSVSFSNLDPTSKTRNETLKPASPVDCFVVSAPKGHSEEKTFSEEEDF